MKNRLIAFGLAASALLSTCSTGQAYEVIHQGLERTALIGPDSIEYIWKNGAHWTKVKTDVQLKRQGQDIFYKGVKVGIIYEKDFSYTCMGAFDKVCNDFFKYDGKGNVVYTLDLLTAPVTTIPSSKGSGGPATAHTITVAGVEMRVFPPKDLSKPVQLAVYLHGDSAKDYLDGWGYSSLQTWAAERNIMLVAALSPNRNSWWHSDAHAKAFKEALDHLHGKYNIMLNSNLYAGVSGGSTFMAMQYIPLQGNNYPGVIAAECGGAYPRTFAYDVKMAARSWKVFFTYGANDYLADPKGAYGAVIPAAVKFYRDNGFNMTEKVVPGVAHCGHDWTADIKEVWGKNVVK